MNPNLQEIKETQAKNEESDDHNMLAKVKLDEYNGTEMVNEEESRREPTFVFW